MVDGVRQLKGWAVCEGDILEQADYPDLFTNIGSTWDAFNHPDGQTGTVGDEQFRLPKLAGLYLGAAGGDLTLGQFAEDKTAKNGLDVSGGTASGTFASSNHNHDQGSLFAGIHAVADGIRFRTTGTTSYTTSISYAGNRSSNPRTQSAGVDVLGDTGTNSASASVSSTPASINEGDAETRPNTAPVSYIIALYNNVANVITTKDFTADTVTSTGDVTVGGNIVGGEATASQAGTVSTGAQTFAGEKTFQDGISGTLTGNVTGNVTGSISGGTVSATSYSNLPVASDSSSGILSTGAQTFAGEKIFQDGARINGISAGGLGGKISNIKTTLSPSTGNLATLSTFTMPLNTVVRVEVYGFDTTGTTGHNGVLLAMCNSGGNGRFRILNDLNSSLGGNNQGFTISVSNQVITIKNKNSMTYGQSAFVVFTAYS